MYTIQALWTAAHHRIGAKFVILNNGAYQLLRLNIQQYWKDLGLPENPFPGVVRPAATRTSSSTCWPRRWASTASASTTREQIGPALDAALADDRPFLIDLVVNNDVPNDVARGQAPEGRPIVTETVSDKETNTMAADLTEAEVKTLVDAWYHALDVHVPVRGDRADGRRRPGGVLLAGGADLRCRRVQGLVRSKVTHLFFDEVHTMKSLEITPRGRRGGRQARRQLAGQGLEPARRRTASGSAWTPARRGSSRAPRTATRAVIKKYVVDGMDLMPGSSPL